jgi:hypothetical protein
MTTNGHFYKNSETYNHSEFNRLFLIYLNTAVFDFSLPSLEEMFLNA